MTDRKYRRREDEFIENNIRFRIISSKMLERYKNTQSFTLTEMLHGQYEFSKTSRETILLSMDRWFQWLLFFEKELIKNKENIFTEHLCLEMIEESHETTRSVRDTLVKFPDIFEREATEMWLTSTQTSFLGWSEVLASYVGKENIEAFSGVATFLTEIMETMKFILYEIDYLVHDGSKPFVCLTNTCILAKEKYGLNILEKRVDTYSSKYPGISNFILKNYSDSKSTQMCADDLSAKGITFTVEEIGGIS